MILKEELVWAEHWQLNPLYRGPQAAGADQIVRKPVDDSRAGRLEPGVVPVRLGPNRLLADKGALLELDEILTVSSASLNMNDQGVILLHLFTLGLALYNLSLNTALALS